ncbi:sodium ABC transporter permease [Brevibacterium sp. GP-SGM9]|uniref:sodium ABC transporter permease n=1 Tax=Brevibacterium sp. GP-SGM9 TaxID=3376990 RepID=UPI0039A70C51
MARKDKGSEDETPEPVVSKGTAGEGIDDLGIPSDDEIEPTEDAKSGVDAKSGADAESDVADAADDGTASADEVSGADDAAAVEVNDPGAEVAAGEDSGDDLGFVEVPAELAEDTPAPEELPETGLVSEFVDVGKRQASWLVSNRESSTALRSPYFLVTGAVIILGILAAIIAGLVGASDKTSGTPSMAMVGVGEQAAMYEQQLGVKITDAEDAESAEKLVREGKVDAAFIQDPSGQGQPTIIALDKQPEALLEKLAPETKATLLNAPAVEDTIATPVLWGMVAFSLLVIATLGTALYQNLRLEKRNRITEIIAATIPPRASASGRITGTISLVVVHLVVAAVIAELGLSLSGKTELAFDMLPGLGWFALALLFTAWSVFALLVWASTVVGAKARTTFLAIIGVITVAGLFAPMFVGATGMVAKVLSWVPFTSPLGIAGRFFAGQAEWWEGLVAAAIAAVLAFILHSLAGGAYVRSVLTGGGRKGKKVKMSKRAKKVAAGSAAAKKPDSADAEAADTNADDDDTDATDTEVKAAKDDDASAASAKSTAKPKRDAAASKDAAATEDDESADNSDDKP